MKTVISILLLLIFVFDFSGELIVFKVRQIQIRREIKRQIKRNVPQEELYVIIVAQSNENELVWKDKNEFVYQGGMYDVVKKETSHDTTIYYCINDTVEEHLFAHLDDLVRKKTGSKNPAGKMVDNLVKLFSAMYSNTENFSHFTYNSPADFYTGFIHRYVSPIININVPPPRFII